MHFTIRINAPKGKVWHTMLDDKTYRVWTGAFCPGSYFEGQWIPGTKMLFLATDEAGDATGMVSRIKEVKPFDFVSIEHLGEVRNGKEDTTSETVLPWAGALENYTFTEIDGVTELQIDQDIDEAHKEMFAGMWPNALQKLKEICEE